MDRHEFYGQFFALVNRAKEDKVPKEEIIEEINLVLKRHYGQEVHWRLVE